MSGPNPSMHECRAAGSISSQQLQELQGFGPCRVVIPRSLADAWRSAYGDLPMNVLVADAVTTASTADARGTGKRTFAEELADLIDQMPAPEPKPEPPAPRCARWKRERRNRYSSR